VALPANATVRYTAPAAHTGALGNLIVTLQGESPRNVTLNGNAVPGAIATNPATVEFPPVCAGDSKDLVVKAYAADVGDIHLMSITSPQNPFAVTAEPPPGTLLPGNHGSDANITVTAHPAAAGDVMDMLVLGTDIPDQPTLSVPVSVKSLAAG